MTDEYWWRNTTIVAGMDIGKKGNPSHLSAFAITKEEHPEAEKEEDKMKEVLVQVSQRFLDGWEYTRQVEFVKATIEYFNIQRMYYDNTRGELEERSLPRKCIPIVLSNVTGRKTKSKMELAVNFSKLVEQHRIKLIDDDRFIAQITCVTNDLHAPNTTAGHGDSFISCMLAIGVYYDFYATDRRLGHANLGDMQELLVKKDVSLRSRDLSDNICKVCRNRVFIYLPDGRKKCERCQTIW